MIGFWLDEHRFALELPAVERIVRIVEITPLPNAPAIMMGAINVEGRVIPAINLRARLGLRQRAVTLNDLIILARTPKRVLALVVDAVEDLHQRQSGQVQTATSIFPNLPYLKGIAKLNDGLVLINDLASFLSLDEEKELDTALAGAVSPR